LSGIAPEVDGDAPVVVLLSGAFPWLPFLLLRQANAALYRIVLTRMSSDPETRRYVMRRRAQGLNTGEIMRCLKRYVARQTFKHLPRPA
jgi:hypothetical protein